MTKLEKNLNKIENYLQDASLTFSPEYLERCEKLLRELGEDKQPFVSVTGDLEEVAFDFIEISGKEVLVLRNGMLRVEDIYDKTKEIKDEELVNEIA